jgi:hypothetical protein
MQWPPGDRTDIGKVSLGAAVGAVQPKTALQLSHLCQKRLFLAGKERILCNKMLDMGLQRGDGRRLANYGRRLLWDGETRLGRCHSRVQTPTPP